MDVTTVSEAKLIAKKQRRKILLSIFIGVAILHILVALTFGSIVIFKHIFQREATFVAPPAAQKKLDPRKLQHQVKVSKQQQKSGRPRMQPRLSASKVSEFSLPEIKSTPQKITDPLKSTLNSVGAPGLGVGTMGGSGGGGLGTGASQVMFFGISSKVERVAVIMDLSPSMVEDQRGGFDGYAALKGEIKDLVRSLNDGSFFNLISFDRRVDVFKPESVLASTQSKKDAATWIDPYWTNTANTRANGALLNNYQPKPETPKLGAISGLTRIDLAIVAAMESNVDAIFIVSDGAVKITGPPNEEEKKEAQRKKEEWDKKNTPAFREQRKKDWEKAYAELQKENERRAKKGLPPKVKEQGGLGNLHDPNFLGSHQFTDEEILSYLKKVAYELYEKKGKKPPRIYTIGYVTTPATEVFLKKLADDFNGSFKRTRTIVKPVNAD